MTTLPPGGGDRTPRPRTRDNGLTAEHFVALRDVDPRLVGTLLETLRLAGIAAYAAPTPHRMGGYLDVRMPERPTDRLWVDGARRADASTLVEGELGSLNLDEDPFDAIIANFHAAPAVGEHPWPDAEDLPAGEPPAPPAPAARVLRSPVVLPPPEPLPGPMESVLDEHFVPEPPPPFPRPPIVTFWAIAGILGGLVMLFGAGFGGWQLDPVLQGVAGVGILGGFVTLIWRMRDVAGDDSDDDGAVL